MEPDSKLNELSYAVIGAAVEVHKILGPGYLESVYEEAMCIELELRGIHFVRQQWTEVLFKDRKVGEGKVDLIIEDQLVVELKTTDAIAPIHIAKTISYLKSTKKLLALIINFNVRVLKDGVKRIVFSDF